MQAALLRVKLPHLARWNQERRARAARYRACFAAARVPAELRLPEDVSDHVYHQFVVRAPRRDALRDFLAERGVSTEVYYPVPLHLQACFADLGYRAGAFPVSEAASREALALPIHPGLPGDAQDYVVEQIAAFYQ